MLLSLWEEMGQFLAGNGALVALVISITELIKGWLKKQAWYASWMPPVLAFILAFIGAIPEAGFVDINWVSYIVHGIGIGLVSVGLYSTLEGLMRKK